MKINKGDSFYPAFDKGFHFIGSMIATGIITFGFNNILIGAGVTLALGITKEISDGVRKDGSGFSFHDLTYDVAGVAIACGFAWLNTHGFSGY